MQFSPVRSGSTLIYNLLREIFPSHLITKVHGLDPFYKNHYVVTTVRHPCDCILSILKIKEAQVSNQTILDAVEHFLEQGGNHLATLDEKEWAHCLVLKYENFQNDFDFIFDKLETFFDIVIQVDLRNKLKSSYNIDEVDKRVQILQNFSEYDPITNWHGKHISETKGKSTFHQVLTKEEINLIMQHETIQKICTKYALSE